MVLLWHILVLIAVLIGESLPVLKSPFQTPYKQNQQEKVSGAQVQNGFLLSTAGIPLTR